MLNQIVLVGRLASDPELYETETGKKIVQMVLAVPRAYKNSAGEYETDFIYCKLWQGIAQRTSDYCKKGDLVGIKGRVETYNYDTEHGRNILPKLSLKKSHFCRQKNNAR